MTSLFIPYQGEKPASLNVKGHRVAVICPERDVAVECLECVGADNVCEVRLDSLREEEEFLGQLAASVNGGVVVIPAETDFHQIICELESQLPWLH